MNDINVYPYNGGSSFTLYRRPFRSFCLGNALRFSRLPVFLPRLLTNKLMDLRISPRSVQHETLRKLRHAITTGYFSPGERLVESVLCERMGVSRNSFREAIGILAAERLVIVTPNRGPSVATMDWEEAQQIYETRALLEGEVAALAARHRTADELRTMDVALADFGRAVTAGDQSFEISATTTFYNALIEASRQRIMGDLIHGLDARITWLRGKSMELPGRVHQSLSEMTAVYVAVEKQDEAGAKAAARDHVHAAREAARLMFDREEDSGWLSSTKAP
ncbi:GntR family transcriptional regulator [Candidimonas nitroreducens]|uniref:GntR family transcriptional regulator n=1 Tax=Candidimonas nitroreducens TaxID=683354 RepID=UPI001178C11C|nr:GntR family transcriptional regulator [Candidimonas nitroreducens]